MRRGLLVGHILAVFAAVDDALAVAIVAREVDAATVLIVLPIVLAYDSNVRVCRIYFGFASLLCPAFCDQMPDLLAMMANPNLFSFSSFAFAFLAVAFAAVAFAISFSSFLTLP